MQASNRARSEASAYILWAASGASLLALAACAPGPTDTVELCDSAGCREVPITTETYQGVPPEAVAPPRDPARYRNASHAELEAMASAGDPHAAFFAGLNHAEGNRVPADKAAAARAFTLAADAGVADAQYNLAMMMFHGDGVRRDSYGAIQMLRRAGNNGDVQAQAALGQLYLTGYEEMGQDLREARKWLVLAAQNGDAEAAARLEEVDVVLADENALRRQLDIWRDYRWGYWYGRRYYGWWHPRWRPYYCCY